MCVEASVFGIPLYEQSGFQFVEYVEIQVPEKWKGRPKIEFTFMRRPAASQASKVNPGENL